MENAANRPLELATLEAGKPASKGQQGRLGRDASPERRRARYIARRAWYQARYQRYKQRFADYQRANDRCKREAARAEFRQEVARLAMADKVRTVPPRVRYSYDFIGPIRVLPAQRPRRRYGCRPRVARAGRYGLWGWHGKYRHNGIARCPSVRERFVRIVRKERAA